MGSNVYTPNLTFQDTLITLLITLLVLFDADFGLMWSSALLLFFCVGMFT